MFLKFWAHEHKFFLPWSSIKSTHSRTIFGNSIPSYILVCSTASAKGIPKTGFTSTETKHMICMKSKVLSEVVCFHSATSPQGGFSQRVKTSLSWVWQVTHPNLGLDLKFLKSPRTSPKLGIVLTLCEIDPSNLLDCSPKYEPMQWSSFDDKKR